MPPPPPPPPNAPPPLRAQSVLPRPSQFVRQVATSILYNARRAARESALQAGMQHLRRQLPIFAAQCENAARRGVTVHICDYPTRDWFECWDDHKSSIVTDPVFRTHFMRRVEEEHRRDLSSALGVGTVNVTVAWPDAFYVINEETRAMSQLLRVTAEWPSFFAGPRGNFAGQCKVCLDDGGEGNTMAALMPCGHMLCVECCDRLLFWRQACPFCRKNVAGVQHLFMP